MTVKEEKESGVSSLRCCHCGGDAFSFRWKWADKSELIALTLCHPGFGFQLEDAIITCHSCARHLEYGNDDDFDLADSN